MCSKCVSHCVFFSLMRSPIGRIVLSRYCVRSLAISKVKEDLGSRINLLRELPKKSLIFISGSLLNFDDFVHLHTM